MRKIGAKKPTTQTSKKPVDPYSTYNSLVLIQNQLTTLDSLISQLKMNFRGDKNATKLLQLADQLRKSIAEKSVKSEDTLAQQTAPLVTPKFKDMFSRVEKYVETLLNGKYEEKATRFLSGIVDGDRHIAGYLLMKGLKGSDNYRYDEFYFILTQVIDAKGNETHYISLTQRFALPGKYSFDAQGDSSAAINRLISNQLKVDKFIGAVRPNKLILTKEEVRLVNSSVTAVTVGSDKIVVTLKPKANVEKVRDDLKRQLIELVRAVAPLNREVVRDRVKTIGGVTKITFVFTLPGNLTSSVLSKTRMADLTKLLELNPSYVKLL